MEGYLWTLGRKREFLLFRQAAQAGQDSLRDVISHRSNH